VYSSEEEETEMRPEKDQPQEEDTGRNPGTASGGVSASGTYAGRSGADEPDMMERVVETGNMWEAYKRVVANKGSAGVDEMTVAELKDHLKAHWPTIREKLLEGTYVPSPVLRVEIPKPGGKGVRKLGIPTVTDRLIQQAMQQVMSPIWDSGFSPHSYGFRTGWSAHDAVKQARAYVEEGRRWVVDMDLEKFFDRVNHDVLMDRVARKVRDRRVLKLIRRYLKAGIMDGGVVEVPRQGTPQGGPLSPLLSNILLDDLDKELERRGHAFCRYADDCNIYVRSRKAGERVLESVSRFLEEKLKLSVNSEKSAVDRPWKRTFLGYSMTAHKKPRLKVGPEAIRRLKAKIKLITASGRGRSLANSIRLLNPLLRGWYNYFSLAQVKNIFEELDGWLRRRLRAVLWRQWKRTYTRAKNLMKRGLSEEKAWKSAGNGRGPWWNAGASHMNIAFPKRYFDVLGLYSFMDHLAVTS
jgi:RNA-directed DNA polymerase